MCGDISSIFLLIISIYASIAEPLTIIFFFGFVLSRVLYPSKEPFNNNILGFNIFVLILLTHTFFLKAYPSITSHLL